MPLAKRGARELTARGCNPVAGDPPQKRASHDLDAAQKDAESAEEDAAFAVDYAYAAIEEAEYAVLDARLARMNADDLASTSSS